MGVTTKEEAMKLTVPKLKEELGSRGLSQDGLKAVLLDRLLTDILKVDAEAQAAAREAEEAKAEEAKAEGIKGGEAAKEAEEMKTEEAAEVAEEAKAEETVGEAEETGEEEAAKAPEEAKPEEEARVAGEGNAEEVETVAAEKAEEPAGAAEEVKAKAGDERQMEVEEQGGEEKQEEPQEDKEGHEQDAADKPVTANGDAVTEAPDEAPRAEAPEESDEKAQKDETSPADGVKELTETEPPEAEAAAEAAEEPKTAVKAEVEADAMTDAPVVEGNAEADAPVVEGNAEADAPVVEGNAEADGDPDGVDEDGKDGPGSPASVGGDEPPSKKAKTLNGAATKKVKLSGDPSGREIFIDNIPEDATEDDVKKLAEEKGGPVGSIRVIRSQPNLPKCKGLALVRFLDRDSAQKALEDIPNEKLGEKELSVRASSNANTLFIGNLNKLWTKEQVLKVFTEQVEGVVNFEVTMDALNRNHNRGFGFATFDTVESCRAAHEKYYKDKLKILDNPVLIDWAETRGNKEDDERGVYILNVDENVEDEAFKANFTKFGLIEKIVYGRLIPHARRKDFAIINFSSRQAAKACIQEMNGTKFMGKELEITMAKAKRKRDFIPYHDRFSPGGRIGGPRNFGAPGGQVHRAPMYSGGYGGRGPGRGGAMYPRPTGGRGFPGGPGIPVAGVPGVAVPGVPGVPAGGFAGPYMAGGAAGRGAYVQPQYQAYQPPGQTYIAGGQAVYQPAPMVYAPAQAYPQPYGAQPVVPQPYLAGGTNTGAPQPWQPPRQF